MIKNCDNCRNQDNSKLMQDCNTFGYPLFADCENWKPKDEQVEVEYNKDMIYQLAMKYALCLTQYGVDITEKLETATQNAIALEKAYIRGRQDECDRFSEWRDRYNNGWIPCSERLPQNAEWVLCYGKNRDGEFKYEVSNYVYEIHCWMCSRIKEVIAWQTLPECYTPKGE